MSCCPITINLQVQRGLTKTQISPLNLRLEKGECYTDKNLVILQDEYLILTNSDTVDYYFSMPV